MKKIIYQRLYSALSMLSIRLNNKLLTKAKIALGAALLVLASSCSSDSDDPEPSCYIMIPADDTVKVQSLPAPDTLIEFYETDKVEDVL